MPKAPHIAGRWNNCSWSMCELSVEQKFEPPHSGMWRLTLECAATIF